MLNPSIVIADDHPLLLKGLNDFLSERKYNIVGSASDGREAYNLIVKTQPDIAILDIQMPFFTGLEIAQNCKSYGIPTKIILITFHKEQELYEKASELNIFGYVLKEFALDEIEACIKAVSENNSYFSPKIKELIDNDTVNHEVLDNLTTSEKKILKYISQDKTNKEIASLLFISHRTVEKHRSNIIQKLKLAPKTNCLLIWAKENSAKLI